MQVRESFFVWNSIEICKTIKIIYGRHGFLSRNRNVVVFGFEFQDSDESNLLIELKSVDIFVVKFNNAAELIICFDLFRVDFALSEYLPNPLIQIRSRVAQNISSSLDTSLTGTNIRSARVLLHICGSQI